MKTAPTDIDREAARLFTPAPGMRALMADPSFSDEWVTICRAVNGNLGGWRPDGIFGFPGSWSVASALAEVVALDTDDPATVGAILAQVRGVAPGFGTGVLHTRPMPTTEDPGRWAVVSCGLPMAWGLTEGAAVVAAMKEVRK